MKCSLALLEHSPINSGNAGYWNAISNKNTEQYIIIYIILQIVIQSKNSIMSFQSYLDNIQTKTGKTAADFKKLAEKKGFLTGSWSFHGFICAF